jgi:hypothetical protein
MSFSSQLHFANSLGSITYNERTADEPLSNRRSLARGAISMIQLNMFGSAAKGIFRSSCVEGGNGSRLGDDLDNNDVLNPRKTKVLEV